MESFHPRDDISNYSRTLRWDVLRDFKNSALLHIMGAQTNILDQAIPYFTVVIGASPLMAWFTSLGASFRALGDTKTPFRVGIEMNAIHIVLDYLLIFGIGSMVIA